MRTLPKVETSHFNVGQSIENDHLVSANVKGSSVTRNKK